MLVDKTGQNNSVRFKKRLDVFRVVADIRYFTVFDTYIRHYDANVFYIYFNVF